MSENLTLEERVAKLEARNRRVEGDKGWETSWTRRLAIMLLTYLTTVFYLRFVLHVSPWVNSLASVIGYLVSTLSVGRLKRHWLNRRTR